MLPTTYTVRNRSAYSSLSTSSNRATTAAIIFALACYASHICTHSIPSCCIRAVSLHRFITSRTITHSDDFTNSAHILPLFFCASPNTHAYHSFHTFQNTPISHILCCIYLTPDCGCKNRSHTSNIEFLNTDTNEQSGVDPKIKTMIMKHKHNKTIRGCYKQQARIIAFSTSYPPPSPSRSSTQTYRYL